MPNLLIIILWSFQISACIAAILSSHRYKKTKQRLFLFFLIYVIITEASGYILSYYRPNFPVYNVFTIVSGFFYLFWFRSILNQKKVITIFIVLFFGSIITSFLLEDFFESLWGISLILLAFLILCCVTLYFSKLLNSSTVIEFQKEQQFWICTGLLIFYLGFMPLLLFQDSYFKLVISDYLFAIMTLNSIMYGFFIISFLCLKEK